MKYNEEKIVKIKSEIQNSISMLEDLKTISFPEFADDKHKVSSAKYNFIVAIEGMIDLCNHIISQNNMNTPSDYADSFRILQKQGAFDEAFLSNLIKASRFRNRLVHIYWEVDTEELYNILQTGLVDIRAFLKNFGEFTGFNNKI